MNKFDLFVAAVILAAVFTVGVHLGTPHEKDNTAVCTLTLITDSPATHLTPSIAYIDARIECRLLECSTDRCTVSVSGTETAAGFLAGGSKYLSLNQPIKLTINGKSVSGRIECMVY